MAGWEFGERNGPNPGSAGSEFGEKTGLNPGLAGLEFRERNGPNPGSAGLEKEPGQTLIRSLEFEERYGRNPSSAGFKAVVLLLLTFCLLLLPLWESVIVLCFVVGLRYFMSILVLQSS